MDVVPGAVERVGDPAVLGLFGSGQLWGVVVEGFLAYEGEIGIITCDGVEDGLLYFEVDLGDGAVVGLSSYVALAGHGLGDVTGVLCDSQGPGEGLVEVDVAHAAMIAVPG